MSLTFTRNAIMSLPKIKVYWLEKSRAQSILWLLEELKLPYELDVFKRDPTTSLAPKDLLKIHPLGKSPLVELRPAETTADADGPAPPPLVLAESGYIFQFLTTHFAAHQGKADLIPQRWAEGHEGDVFGETEAYRRYEYLLHYAEGSLMPYIVMSLILGRMGSSAVPFPIRPITGMVAGRVSQSYIVPNMKRHFAMLEGMLSSSGGRFITGNSLTAADILLSFPLFAAMARCASLEQWEKGSLEATYPLLAKYADALKSQPGYEASKERIKKETGEFQDLLR
ncbi:Glutathione S-transferase 1 [Ceratocystis lukuohia]|uniref:Glutathione S-transferase 1 n=1 Tax=Ceratocystis lukuohia TaxID=2019550 RepID=A0ABR4MIF7_9PEZI